MMTSAYAPKYLPAFASDHPVLPFDRCLAEAAALPFREGVLEKYPRENALAVFRWDSA